MSYLLRVQLPDRPGSLGSLAVALGSVGADILSLDVIERGDGYAVDGVTVVAASPTRVTLEVDGVRRRFAVARYVDAQNRAVTYVDSDATSVTLRDVPRFTDPSAVGKPGSLLAPMPGSVIRIAVEIGDQVTQGQPLLWLEAMKMEHTVHAPADGVVAELAVVAGQQLAVGDVLAVISSDTLSQNNPSGDSATEETA